MLSTKIMYLNPVSSDSADQLFADMVREHKRPECEVHVTSLNSSIGTITNLEYRTYEAIVTADTIRATYQAAQEGFDALILGCFYDTALHDAREISGDMVVLAPCQASIQIAMNLANSFSVIVGKRKWVHQMESTVHEYGYGKKLKSFRDVDLGVVEFQQDHDVTRNRLLSEAHKAINEDYAESIILGCTLEFGFYEEMQAELGVPVIDPSIAALKAAEQAAFLKQQQGWRPSRKWGSEAPPQDEIEAFGLFSQPYEFGNRIIVPSE
ncbi:MAG: aspartate/glutamate racemase family protein [Chloroflexota bacterium]